MVMFGLNFLWFKFSSLFFCLCPQTKCTARTICAPRVFPSVDLHLCYSIIDSPCWALLQMKKICSDLFAFDTLLARCSEGVLQLVLPWGSFEWKGDFPGKCLFLTRCVYLKIYLNNKIKLFFFLWLTQKHYKANKVCPIALTERYFFPRKLCPYHRGTRQDNDALFILIARWRHLWSPARHWVCDGTLCRDFPPTPPHRNPHHSVIPRIVQGFHPGLCRLSSPATKDGHKLTARREIRDGMSRRKIVIFLIWKNIMIRGRAKKMFWKMDLIYDRTRTLLPSPFPSKIGTVYEFLMLIIRA